MRRLLPLAPVFAWTFAALAWADAPKIVGPESIEASRLVRLRIEGEAESVVYFVEPAELADVFDGPDGKSAIFTGPPGRYVVQATTLANGKLGKARLVVVIGQPAPVPTPTPTPGPPPDPRPPPAPAPVVTGTLHVSLVYDLASLVPDMTAVRTGEAIRKEPGVAYRTYPVTSPALDALKLRRVLVPDAPTLVVQDEQGNVLSATTAPSDEAAVVAKIRALRGAK